MKKVLWIVFLIVAVTLPALATHIQEPTAPITGLSLRVYNYPNQQTVLTACDGSEVVDWERFRVEPLVDAADRPSEHWTTKIVIFHTTGSSANWESLYPHQNIGPHHPINDFEMNQISQTHEPGPWHVLVRVTGNESGNVFEETCDWVAE